MYAQGTDPLSRIQESMRKEIAELRDFTQHLRSLELDSGRLLGYLSGIATRFEVEHGIRTRFVAEVEEVDLRPGVCAEVARIAQEALVNVGKHSNATEALVRLGRRNGNWVLGIMDNGRGFGFSGRLSHRELLASGKGPSVIMERAHEINGEVSIESYETGGCCLEVVF